MSANSAITPHIIQTLNPISQYTSHIYLLHTIYSMPYIKHILVIHEIHTRHHE